MSRLQLVLLLLGVAAQVADAAKFLDQLSRSTIDVLHGSQRPGQVRQCTCQEMSDCYESAKQEAFDCFTPCWGKVPPINDDPASLKICFDQRESFLSELVNCFKVRFKACAANQDAAEKVLVHKYDYQDMIHRVEQVIDEQMHKFLQTITSPAVKRVLNSAALLGKCVKECFLEKNKGGFCFDKKGCQPNISDRNARNAIRQCSRQINWKREVGELCKCSSKAGVGGIGDYCGMLNVMG